MSVAAAHRRPQHPRAAEPAVGGDVQGDSGAAAGHVELEAGDSGGQNARVVAQHGRIQLCRLDVTRAVVDTFTDFLADLEAI